MTTVAAKSIGIAAGPAVHRALRRGDLVFMDPTRRIQAARWAGARRARSEARPERQHRVHALVTGQ